jgi:hypothetical protein
MADRWRSEEDESLRRVYSEGAPLALIARELGRSEDAVTARRRAIGIPGRHASRPWTMLEDELLRRATRAKLPTTEVAPRLRRPVEQVRRRRRQLGLGRAATRRYTAAERALLQAEWAAGADVDALALRLARSPEALRLHARQLGLHHPRGRRRWSDPEDAIVRDGYADGLTCHEIAVRLEGRTPAAIAARARKLGLATYARRWTAADDARLARVLALRPIDDAARLLGRTPEAVRRRARNAGFRSSPPGGMRARARGGLRKKMRSSPCMEP